MTADLEGANTSPRGEYTESQTWDSQPYTGERALAWSPVLKDICSCVAERRLGDCVKWSLANFPEEGTSAHGYLLTTVMGTRTSFTTVAWIRDIIVHEGRIGFNVR